MYFSYCIRYRDEENQCTKNNWTTVCLSDDMKYLINSSGVKSPLTASFMKYKHVFHDLPLTNDELNRCLVGAETSCENELKLCPFCGGIPERVDDSAEDGHRDGPYSIFCSSCGNGTDIHISQEEAEKHWNRRLTSIEVNLKKE